MYVGGGSKVKGRAKSDKDWAERELR